MGTKRTPGTTIFSLEGAVQNAGLVEVPLRHHAPRPGLRDRRRLPGERPLKAIQAGGPSRGCIARRRCSTWPSTPRTAPAKRSCIGTGGMIVLDDDGLHGRHGPLPGGLLHGRVVRQVRALPRGTKQMLRILTRMCEGQGTRPTTWRCWSGWPSTVKSAAVCGMGGMAPDAVLATLATFPRRVRGPHPRPAAVPGRRVPQAWRRERGPTLEEERIYA